MRHFALLLVFLLTLGGLSQAYADASSSAQGHDVQPATLGALWLEQATRHEPRSDKDPAGGGDANTGISPTQTLLPSARGICPSDADGHPPKPRGAFASHAARAPPPAT